MDSVSTPEQVIYGFVAFNGRLFTVSMKRDGTKLGQEIPQAEGLMFAGHEYDYALDKMESGEMAHRIDIVQGSSFLLEEDGSGLVFQDGNWSRRKFDMSSF
ncbi:MAG: hypothetical protein COY40_02220 [Alphaproteobacteria bacterium CG_4_10_14_0_8_um_filter_53_9]|nr:MAG: hypothetical protein COY40_02220 [Alphaproteobacteria bacterium CG_4_10_14_0_8_um_filter_53_9]